MFIIYLRLLLYLSCMTLCFIIRLYLTYFIVITFNFQVLPSDLFGWFKWPFQGLSDLHLGDQKVTWKKLVVFHTISFAFLLDGKTFPKIPWKRCHWPSECSRLALDRGVGSWRVSCTHILCFIWCLGPIFMWYHLQKSTSATERPPKSFSAWFRKVVCFARWHLSSFMVGRHGSTQFQLPNPSVSDAKRRHG